MYVGGLCGRGASVLHEGQPSGAPAAACVAQLLGLPHTDTGKEGSKLRKC